MARRGGRREAAEKLNRGKMTEIGVDRDREDKGMSREIGMSRGRRTITNSHVSVICHNKTHIVLLMSRHKKGNMQNI